MTVLGEFLSKESIKKSDGSFKSGINNSRLSELSRSKSTKIKVEEVFFVSLAIGVESNEILNEVYKHLKLNKVK